MSDQRSGTMIRDNEIRTRLSSGDPNESAISPSRLADYWGVHVNTVYRDIRKGALRAFRLPSGRVRIRRGDADRYGRPIE